MATNVPPVTFGPNGFIAPAESAILGGVQADINAAFGGNLNPGLSTPQGQLASSEAAVIGNVNDTFLFFTNQVDPAFAAGRMQDAIGRIYNLERLPALPTVIQVACSGLNGVPIPVNALLQDPQGNTYACLAQQIIPASGVVSCSFANTVPGPTAVPSSVKIFQAIPGWDSATVISGVVGSSVETRAAFEARRQATLGASSAASLSSIQGAVLNVPGVVDAYVTENTASGTATIGGVVLAGKSIYVAVVGGNSTAVATAIWSKKPPGAAYNGNTTVNVQDPNPAYSPPIPTYPVTYQIPTNLEIVFNINIKNSPAVPATALAQVQGAILNAFTGGDGVPKARIGSTIFALNYASAIGALGPWAQLVSIGVGSPNVASAQVSGTISGGTLTVTSVVSGTLSVGQSLTVNGSAGGTGVIMQGTKIAFLLTGTGGAGTYAVNIPQSFAGPIIAFSASQTQVSVNINQEPTLVAADVGLVLSP